jgi:hypothetical protein
MLSKKYLTSTIVNSANFQNPKICQILLFLHNLKYTVSEVEILHIDITQHSLHLDLFSDFLKNFKCYFKFFKK